MKLTGVIGEGIDFSKEDLEKINPRKIRARGPWVLVYAPHEKVKKRGGLFVPDGTWEERVGFARGLVVHYGGGEPIRTKAHVLQTAPYTGPQVVRDGKPVFKSFPELRPGVVAVFRGHLANANAAQGNRRFRTDGSLCFVHHEDIQMVEEPDEGR